MRNAPLSRRLGAMLYDGLLVVALMMFATVPFVIVRGGESVEPGDPYYRLTMLIIAWLFFAGFWSRSGRTLGLQAWRLRIETSSGERPGFGAASLRFLAALISWLPLGLGFWWQLWDKDSLSWHDRLSGTRLRYYPKKS
jgi:uncharacterized RDD family membrane protein YckC